MEGKCTAVQILLDEQGWLAKGKKRQNHKNHCRHIHTPRISKHVLKDMKSSETVVSIPMLCNKKLKSNDWLTDFSILATSDE